MSMKKSDNSYHLEADILFKGEKTSTFFFFRSKPFKIWQERSSKEKRMRIDKCGAREWFFNSRVRVSWDLSEYLKEFWELAMLTSGCRKRKQTMQRPRTGENTDSLRDRKVANVLEKSERAVENKIGGISRVYWIKFHGTIW